MSSSASAKAAFRPFSRPARSAPAGGALAGALPGSLPGQRIHPFQAACCRALCLAGFHVDDLNVTFPGELGLTYGSNPRSVRVDIIATGPAGEVSFYCFCRDPLFGSIRRSRPEGLAGRNVLPGRPALDLASFVYVARAAGLLHEQGWGPVLLLVPDDPPSPEGLRLCRSLDPESVFDVISLGAAEGHRRLAWLAGAGPAELEDDLGARRRLWQARQGKGRRQPVVTP